MLSRVPRALNEHSPREDPVGQFLTWLADARTAGGAWADAMTVATATPGGRPSARAVLLRGVDERGFLFFTDYHSRKGRELTANARAALVFIWPELHRQVRVEGTVRRIPAKESDDYFMSRPRGSRLAAVASRQGRAIASRELLERRVRQVSKRYRGQPIPRPPRWGGYRVAPTTIEFWQGRANRLHDRLGYLKLTDGSWRRQRLQP